MGNFLAHRQGDAIPFSFIGMARDGPGHSSHAGAASHGGTVRNFAQELQRDGEREMPGSATFSSWLAQE